MYFFDVEIDISHLLSKTTFQINQTKKNSIDLTSLLPPFDNYLYLILNNY
jgi:hypothetical protein